ncbi:hypothetical protein OHC33_000561 [Knufia fluminis]|uniref:C2H2-type domain-containing protein n=1 Tax=Knufia fluminis TaxID=191047 RepID=A0AAN8ETQ2_9EURO|nr:hypothetical protein OHC33_000561 [Knufia fluminis]
MRTPEEEFKVSSSSFLPSTEWELHKTVIRGLYITKNLPLKDVQHELSERYNFHASTKQWKERLKAWGFAKNVAASDMHRIVEHFGKTNLESMNQSHPGQYLEFEGRQVPLSRVTRHAQRTRSPLCRELNLTGAPTKAPRKVINNANTTKDITLVHNMSDITPRPAIATQLIATDEAFDFAGSPFPSSRSGMDTGITDSSRSRFVQKRGLSPACSISVGGPSRRGSDSTATKLFACPYFKHNPLKFSARNTTQLAYRSCATVVLRNTAQIKQHLYRVHRMPDFYCEKCLRQFANASELNSHDRSCFCKAPSTSFEGKMTHDQYRKVKKRQTQSDQRDGWYEILDILFPQMPRPNSPYIEDNEDQESVHHVVNIFRSLGLDRTRDLYDAVTGDNPEQPPVRPLPASTRHILDEAYDTFSSDQSYEQWISGPTVTSPTSLSFPGVAEDLQSDNGQSKWLDNLFQLPDFNLPSYDAELELADDKNEFLWIDPVDGMANCSPSKQEDMEMDVARPLVDYI